MTLVGVKAPHVKPPGTISVKVTVPLKWFNEVTVTVEVARTPTSTGAGDVAVMLKSRNMNVTVAE